MYSMNVKVINNQKCILVSDVLSNLNWNQSFNRKFKNYIAKISYDYWQLDLNKYCFPFVRVNQNIKLFNCWQEWSNISPVNYDNYYLTKDGCESLFNYIVQSQLHDKPTSSSEYNKLIKENAEIMKFGNLIQQLYGIEAKSHIKELKANHPIDDKPTYSVPISEKKNKFSFLSRIMNKVCLKSKD